MDLASLSASLWLPFWRNWRARLHSLLVVIGDEELGEEEEEEEEDEGLAAFLPVILIS